jgi:uncharacterized protein
MTTILWRRVDCPGEESAFLDERDTEWQLHGAVHLELQGEEWRIDYLVTCDREWETRVAVVDAWRGAASEHRRLVIVHREDGQWLVDGNEVPGLEGCCDIDLGFSPSTNTLPIRRLGLAEGQSAEFAAAWLRFPELTLEKLDQRYTRLDEQTYRYESGGGAFERELTVNDEGFVSDYPGFWHAVL